MPKQSQVNPWKNLVAGGFGGVCCIVTGHPLDTIKVRLQTMPRLAPGQQPVYKGALDCARKIVGKEGFLALYKGMGAPLVLSAPTIAVTFVGYGLGKSMQRIPIHDDISYGQIFGAGAVAGALTTVVITPAERIKCLLQVQPGDGLSKRYSGPLDCARKLYRSGGLFSLYRGATASLGREVAGSALQFTVFELVLQAVTMDQPREHISLWKCLLAGGMGGSCYWAAVMPLDVLKSQVQAAPEGRHPRALRDALAKVLREDGAKGLYRGGGPAVVRAFPATAACFAGYETAMKTLNWLRVDAT